MVTAVTALVEQAYLQGGPEVSLTILGPEQRLSPQLELAAFRIVQEGLNNARRHSQAEHAAVELNFTEDGLSVSIQDDGIGFKPPQLPYELTRRGYFGLAGMHERVSLVGASVGGLGSGSWDVAGRLDALPRPELTVPSPVGLPTTRLNQAKLRARLRATWPCSRSFRRAILVIKILRGTAILSEE